MSAPDIAAPAEQSPRARFLEAAARGELAYQRGRCGTALFPPRLVAPLGVDGPLDWAVSAGLGRVHSVTLVHVRGAEPHAVALVDLDEGFRMMSRIDTPDPAAVAIGDRLRVAFRPLEEGGPPLPVFAPAEATA